VGSSLEDTSRSPAIDSPKTFLPWGTFAVSGIVRGKSGLPQQLTASQVMLVSKIASRFPT